MKVRTKKKCGKCEYWAGLPYVHCTLGCEINNITQDGAFYSMPVDSIKCRNARQERIEVENMAEEYIEAETEYMKGNDSTIDDLSAACFLPKDYE